MRLSLYVCLLISLPSSLLAQGNYVANTPNSASPGTFNTLVGPGAGAAGPITGDRNTITGYNAGLVLTSGKWNTFNGVDAGRFTTTGSYNTFIGQESGLYNTTGSANAYLGRGAGYSNSTGSYNAFMGYLVGYANTTGSSNVFVGAFSGSANTSGSSNAFIGYFAGHTNSTGNSDTFVGTGAGEYNTTGSGNAFLGYAAGFRNTTGFNNSFLGYGAGQSNTTGSYNTYMGGGAAILNITGSQNVFLGNDAGYFSTSNTQNTLVGYQSGYNSNGDANTFLGHQSGFDNTSGLRNVAVGQKAGANNQTGSDNVFVGYGAKAGTANPTNVTNAVAIGANAVVSQSNSMVLGSRLNVGIGNSAPSAKLHITAGVANTSGLRLENLTSSSPATLLNRTKFLSVDGSGNVVLASVNGSARESAPEAVWQQEGKYLHNVTGDGVVIGQGVSKMPDGYALFVANGILTEKIKVAIKNTTDWSDHVFAKNYPLRSLYEVDQYIQQTGHLPGIPSAKEVVKNGVDLGKMDAILLEKIEEITLYLIDLQKEVATLRRENQALKHENAKIGKRLNASVYKARN